MKNIDIILPVYNEEEAIGIFHRTLSGVLQDLQHRYRFHFIYVLDRSRDRSFSILKEIAESQSNVTVIHMSRRFGHQMSLVAGIDFSRGDAAIMMDSDLQHPPELLATLLEEFEKGYDIVHTKREYAQSASVLKKATSHLFYRVQNWLAPIEIPPGVADFRLISRKVVQVFQRDIREHNQFLRGLFQWVGFRSTYVPFLCARRVGGRTKYDVARLLAFSADGIISFSRVPLRTAVLLGLCMSVLSASYAVWLIIKFFVRGGFPIGYPSLIVAILFVGGLQLTVLGIIGEYIGHIFDEVKQRPLYVVQEIVGEGSADFDARYRTATALPAPDR